MKSSLSLTLILAAIVTLAAGQFVYAGKGDKSEKGDKGKKPELADLELSGTVASKEVEKKGKDGGTLTITVYYLETDDEKIHLPEPHAKKKGEAPPFKLADFAGAKVKINAKGFTRPGKKGGTSTYVHQIVKIERVET